MTGKMNWHKASLRSKASVSVLDEADAMERDPAARWLERYTRWQAKSAVQGRQRRNKKTGRNR